MFRRLYDMFASLFGVLLEEPYHVHFLLQLLETLGHFRHGVVQDVQLSQTGHLDDRFRQELQQVVVYVEHLQALHLGQVLVQLGEIVARNVEMDQPAKVGHIVWEDCDAVVGDVEDL